MAHINVPEGVPGIRSLVMFRPETGKPLYELAQILLRGESTLSPAERELIAAYAQQKSGWRIFSIHLTISMQQGGRVHRVTGVAVVFYGADF